MASSSPIVLTVKAEDGPGIVALLASAIQSAGGNIVDLGQHSDPTTQVFAARIEIAPGVDQRALAAALDRADRVIPLEYQLHTNTMRPRVVLACSSQLHVLADVLARVDVGEFDVEVAGVVSDRLDAQRIATRYALPFIHVAARDDRNAEADEFASALEQLNPDVVVLARYMRILPAHVVEAYEGRMINIHHSFLPAFVGARPYERAHNRGVKMIGATAHYVTSDLDEGPIIAQDVIAVTHAHAPEDLARRGRDIERNVLASALRLHLEHRIVVFANRTCVFD